MADRSRRRPGHPAATSSRGASPATKLGVDEYYAYIFEHSVPGLPEHAAAEGLTPLEYMRRYGAFEVAAPDRPAARGTVPPDDLQEVGEDAFGRVYTRAPKADAPNIVPQPSPEPDADGRRPVGVRVDGAVLRGFPTPSGRLEFYSRTLAEWGWPEYALPTYIPSHVHPDRLAADERVLISTFRLPVHIHTRSANAKWLDEIAHTNPLWIHPRDAAALGVDTGDLVRVETAIGHFVVKAWVTEGMRPGVVACSHHMGRWKLHDHGQRQLMATVRLTHADARWDLARTAGVRAIRVRRSRHRAPVVDRRGRAPEPDVPGASRPRVGTALLASGRAAAARRPRRPLRRRRGGHGEGPRDLPRVAGQVPAGGHPLPRPHPAAVLALAAAQAGEAALPAHPNAVAWSSSARSRS